MLRWFAIRWYLHKNFKCSLRIVFQSQPYSENLTHIEQFVIPVFCRVGTHARFPNCEIWFETPSSVRVCANMYTYE